jgi:hypothetical protein
MKVIELKEILKENAADVKEFWNENVVSEELSFAIYEYMCQEGLMPYEVCKNGDPRELIDKFLFDNCIELPSISKYDE